MSMRNVLRVGNWGMAVFLALVVLSIVASYPMSVYLTLNQQVAAHILTILFAGVFKVCYVLRCLAQYDLGMEVR
ncbi:hypothetical protein [Vibrio barjaei]|uniref:hypothetical protein n=1 Tax=Vibrio barjaei TaxID=1676683 RepID=UPI00228384DE|nr:hypothetical protein [Vibrio barjaei]MCY9874777.1 hypothetical protein [Vibrio barjaei]